MTTNEPTEYDRPDMPEPEDCDRHGERTLVIAEQHASTIGTAQLIQYRCAHEGCDRYLGWHFNDRRDSYTSQGTGRCQDQAVLARIKADRHDETTLWILTLPAVAILAATISLLMGWSHLEYLGRGVHLSVMAGCAAATVLLYTRRRRTRPKVPLEAKRQE